MHVHGQPYNDILVDVDVAVSVVLMHCVMHCVIAVSFMRSGLLHVLRPMA